jgi:hypothetical protein
MMERLTITSRKVAKNIETMLPVQFSLSRDFDNVPMRRH